MRCPDDPDCYIRRVPVLVDGKTTIVEDIMVEVMPHVAVALNCLEADEKQRKRIINNMKNAKAEGLA